MEFQFKTINFPEGKSFLVQRQQYEEYSVFHAHKDYELNLIKSGTGKRIVGNNISSFKEYDLVLIGPDLPHCREFSKPESDNAPECLVLYISRATFNNTLIQIPELELILNLFRKALNGIAFSGAKVKEVATQMGQLADFDGFESFIAITKLLHSLTEIEEQEILSLNPELIVSYYKDLDHIKTVYNYVLRHSQDTITLETAAGLLHMAPESFCRYFKKRTGKTFIQYVKDIRISMASKMLSETEKPIAQICYESGYNNLANFNFYFKSIMKMTPSEYRKNFR